ncbi:MAG: 50S ribosomal protein L29 [Bacteroidales bacterium]|nr:50S ribosomal protein L29 [Bacteroidales bacterium]MCB8999229.1 50S ribosomal protein L29 [Bacteroidales bacterium]MCB9013103.1 50S ribosomal protein L29 [Bacteroidales bacterium]
MKTSEIKELSTKELKERIDSEKELLVRMRLNHAVSPLDNPMKIRDSRKNVARMQTELVLRLSTENTKK